MIVDDDAAVADVYGTGLTDGGFMAIALADASSLFEALDIEMPVCIAHSSSLVRLRAL